MTGVGISDKVVPRQARSRQIMPTDDSISKYPAMVYISRLVDDMVAQKTGPLQAAVTVVWRDVQGVVESVATTLFYYLYAAES